MNDALEHDIYKPVDITHLPYLVQFACYFCGSAGFSEFILVKIPSTLIFIVRLLYQI